MDVVLDTNIAVSAAITPAGNPADVIRAWQAGRFRWITSLPLIAELERTLRSDRLQRYMAWSVSDVEGFLAIVRASGAIVSPQTEINRITTDPPDNRVLEAAVEARADYIVTGDSHLLGLKRHESTDIVTPARVLAILTSEEMNP